MIFLFPVEIKTVTLISKRINTNIAAEYLIFLLDQPNATVSRQGLRFCRTLYQNKKQKKTGSGRNKENVTHSPSYSICTVAFGYTGSWIFKILYF